MLLSSYLDSSWDLFPFFFSFFFIMIQSANLQGLEPPIPLTVTADATTLQLPNKSSWNRSDQRDDYILGDADGTSSGLMGPRDTETTGLEPAPTWQCSHARRGGEAERKNVLRWIMQLPVTTRGQGGEFSTCLKCGPNQDAHCLIPL